MTQLFSVVALLWQGPQILAVSRKDNHEDFGLPGGKINPGESPEDAIRREVAEEAGLTLSSLTPVFDHLDRVVGGERRPCRCYVADWAGVPRSMEGAKVAWVLPGRLLFQACSFRDYNRALFSHLNVPTTDLDWTQRPDTLWNAECACGSFLVGIRAEDQAEVEAWHRQEALREQGQRGCGPVLCKICRKSPVSRTGLNIAGRCFECFIDDEEKA